MSSFAQHNRSLFNLRKFMPPKMPAVTRRPAAVAVDPVEQHKRAAAEAKAASKKAMDLKDVAEKHVLVKEKNKLSKRVDKHKEDQHHAKNARVQLETQLKLQREKDDTQDHSALQDAFDKAQKKELDTKAKVKETQDKLAVKTKAVEQAGGRRRHTRHKRRKSKHRRRKRRTKRRRRKRHTKKRRKRHTKKRHRSRRR